MGLMSVEQAPLNSQFQNAFSDGEQVTEITAALDETYASEIFTTCKDLRVPLMGKISSMVCQGSEVGKHMV